MRAGGSAVADSERPGSARGRRKRSPIVVDSSGAGSRFLRGMITHDLVQRGLSFDDGFAVASEIRDEVAGRYEVTTSELRELIEKRLTDRLGADGGDLVEVAFGEETTVDGGWGPSACVQADELP